MRGKVLKNRVKSGQPRITPAYAGKRRQTAVSVRRMEDHPRVCGEKFHVLYYYGYNKGSPPRMRGKD